MSQITSWNPAVYAQNARFVSDLGAALLPLLDPNPGELILDLGCGDGALTKKIAACGCKVFGVDFSHTQIQAARKRHLWALVMDGHEFCFKQSFDAVFSNAALHWMGKPGKVVQNVWNSLKAGGRFVGEFGGKGNIETIRSALHAGLRRRSIEPLTIDPWYYPSAEEFAQLLKGIGFEVNHIDLMPRLTRLPGDISSWLEVFAQPFTRSVAPGEADVYLAEVRERVRESLQNSEGIWFADYVRLRFKASKPLGSDELHKNCRSYERIQKERGKPTRCPRSLIRYE